MLLSHPQALRTMAVRPMLTAVAAAATVSEPVVAAALRELRGQVASLRGDGVIKRERAVADAIADVVQTVIELAELLAEQNLLLAGGSCILTKFALAVAPAVAVEAPEEKKQNEPNCTIAAPSVITAIDSSAEIRKTVIIQNNHSFQFI